MSRENSNFLNVKTVVGGIRNDSAPTTNDEDPVALRLNQYSELLVNSAGEGSSVSATLADLASMGDGTTYYYIDMEGFRRLSLQLELDGGSGTMTATIEMTLQNDGTAQASCSYLDVTASAYGTSTYTTSSMLVDDTGYFANAKYVRVKIVISGASNDAALTIYSGKIF
jgi:hypothetical protein